MLFAGEGAEGFCEFFAGGSAFLDDGHGEESRGDVVATGGAEGCARKEGGVDGVYVVHVRVGWVWDSGGRMTLKFNLGNHPSIPNGEEGLMFLGGGGAGQG